jgi:CO/xanthine dehydrogenase Mo-binding subunit
MGSQAVGKTVQRKGGRERVTGAQKYVGDIRLDSVLHVKLVHLDCGHARIDAIYTQAARRMPGVVDVVTAADMPDPMPRFGPMVKDRPVIAIHETKYSGEPVAAVVAESEDAAKAAAQAIRVDYEELPGIYSVEAALDPETPLVQDPSLRPESPFREANIVKEWHYGWGDVDTNSADLVIENTYTFPMITHFSIEPFIFMAAPSEEGVTIWSAIQHPYLLQRIVAGVLDMPVSKVRVISPDPGGGFGGKGYPKFEPLLAILALRNGRPVRLALTLEESFQASRRAATRIDVRTGVNADGRLVFQDAQVNYLLGAYVDIGDRVVSKSSYVTTGVYKVPNARIVARGLLSHTVPSTAFRGFGVPQVTWAMESQLDEAARRLGIDRLEIRLRNMPKKGEAFIPNDTPADGDWAEVLQKAAQAIGWGQPLAKNRGRGLAMGVKNSATATISQVIVRLHFDGSATVMSGTSDMGQGARTVLAQIASHELGIPVEHIAIAMGDTANVPYDTTTSASRSTVFMGNAIKNACRKIKDELKAMAAEGYQLPPSEIHVEPGKVILPGKELSYADCMLQYYGPIRGEVIGVGAARAKYNPEHPLGGKISFWEVVAVGCEVEVDEETGYVLLRDMVLVSDIGKAINPKQVHAQDEGAAVMGIGHTQMEHLILNEKGGIVNLGALDYRIPTIQDIPDRLHSLLVENQDGPGPYGSKGAGESGILAISPAVASAIHEATGLTLRDLPMTPEKIWRALQSTGPDRF